jgi:hypothetical protein
MLYNFAFHLCHPVENSLLTFIPFSVLPRPDVSRSAATVARTFINRQNVEDSSDSAAHPQRPWRKGRCIFLVLATVLLLIPLSARARGARYLRQSARSRSAIDRVGVLATRQLSVLPIVDESVGIASVNKEAPCSWISSGDQSKLDYRRKMYWLRCVGDLYMILVICALGASRLPLIFRNNAARLSTMPLIRAIAFSAPLFPTLDVCYLPVSVYGHWFALVHHMSVQDWSLHGYGIGLSDKPLHYLLRCLL